ncbi:MAG: branched-chain amino acid ABC transporter permease [Candidatus Rokuibacteriota bacterium]|nr:MAG: branched-chain amino acid ABC transporter permease [Candidatus Rokubacteria bacterium]
MTPALSVTARRAGGWRLALVLALAVAVGLPALTNTYYVRLATGILMFAALACGWNLIGGYAGYPDFGAAAFLGIGAYTTGVLMARAAVPFPLALLAGGAVLLRLRGHYFAIATLGFMLVLQQLAANLELTGGGSGMNLPVARSFTTFYYWMLGVCALAVAAGLSLPRLRVGYAIAAIRENQAAAEALGIAPLPYKIVAYSGSAFVFGLVGGVYAYWFTFIDPPTVFNVDFAIQAIVMTLFGGPATALGPVAGAIVLKSLDTVLTNVSIFLHNVFFGALVCLLVVFAPRGLADLRRARGGILAALRATLRENRI